MSYNKYRKIKISLTLAAWLLAVLSVASLLVFSFSFLKPAVLALSGDYNSAAAGLSIDDWNFLDEDFVMKEGDTMTGDLVMGTLPATFGITGLSTDSFDPSGAASVDFADSTQ